ncbi:hypothetical protein TRFO_23002 [Tritrichomonas foetus]|uniref:Uncharacterized protein n=1 Tax=Tritrichomonas foetus TaxID=1144522 RepID=A0A1J4KFS3_9EUKA|nr:hypothetical protein TRFO_23002 [Tritrichomonas foetus]|eukprot:OHT08486.1 hypothetical protein TRFO_23002 [Tritrichomonas foetus]
MKMSSKINIITNKKTESIGIAFADSNQRVYYAYPIIATIMLFFDNMTEDISNCNNLYIYCYQVEDNSENLGHIFSNIRSTDYMYIYFSEPLTLDIESLLHFSLYSISIIGENSDKSYILLTNNQKLVLSINLINSTLEFLDDTAYLESDPYIENGKIIDMEKLIIQNKNCDLTELSLCLGTHYEEINIITIVTSNIDIVLNNDGMIVNGIPVMAGEENLNSEKLNILFMFVSLGEYNLTFQMDPNSYKSHPVTFQILTYHKMNVYFDINSFDRDLMTPVELNFTYFSQDYISFFVHEVPERNVILKVFSPSNDNSFFDMSPISVSQMGICFPQMICIPNQVDDYLYFSYGGDLDLVKNRINNSKESENFQKLTITYPYLYADIPYLYKTVYDDLDLDKFDRNLEFVGDPHIILPQVEIETEKDFNGKRLTVDNIVLVINKHWILPELIMNNDGIITSNGTTAQYAEVDSSNIDKVRRIYFDTLLVRTPLIDGEILNILFETNRITINNRSIPLFTNFTLKFLFTQDVIKSEHLNVYLDTISESAVKSATFIFANVRTKVDVYFSNEFPKISNSPFFLFISENHLEVEIKNVNQPIRYRYENSNGEIYEEFPINNYEEIYICYSNQSIFYDDCYNLSQTISYYFKKIDDDYELHHLLQSKVSKTFKELHLYLFSPIDITLNFRDLDLIPNQLFIIGNETIEEEENQSKISIFLPENRKFELLKANNVFITVENATLQSDSIDLYHCTLEARVNVSQFNCTIFDVSSLKGRINTLNLNYTFSNSQWKNIKKTGLNVSNNINSSQKIIQFSENSLNIDSNQVYLSDISVQKTFYELFFTESETIYFDFSEISKETNYNFIITFKEFDEKDELYNQKKSLVIRFTNSWKNFNYQSQSKILIKIDRNSLNEHFLKLHSIIYYSEEIPSFVVLTVVNGSDLIYPPETERKSNKQDNISVAVIGCSVVCIITILCGVILLCKYKSNLKKDHENLFMLIDHWVRK